MVRRKKKRSIGRNIRAAFFLLLLLSGAAYFYHYYTLSHRAHKDYGITIPEGFSSVGIDVSHHQGKINWEHLYDTAFASTPPDFVYLKATEGMTHVDTRWKRNRASCLKLSIKHGAYHFFQPKKLPIPQAEHFLAYYIPQAGDLPPVLDVETEGYSDEDLIHKMTRWLEYVEEKTGMRPIIYTSYHFYKIKFKTKFPTYKFWIASYSRKPKGIMENAQIIHWQFTEKAHLPGHQVLVDMNVSKVPF
jgi:lysozyme